jgi:putative transcriptional regulator
MNVANTKKARRPATKRKWSARKQIGHRPRITKHDWRRADAMTEQQVEAAALSDADARPLTPDSARRMRRVPQVKVVRQALGLSQDDFAEAFGIPVGTLRDWEQGRAEPDQAARSYLKVIARMPHKVRAVLDSVT